MFLLLWYAGMLWMFSTHTLYVLAPWYSGRLRPVSSAVLGWLLLSNRGKGIMYSEYLFLLLSSLSPSHRVMILTIASKGFFFFLIQAYKSASVHWMFSFTDEMTYWASGYWNKMVLFFTVLINAFSLLHC